MSKMSELDRKVRMREPLTELEWRLVDAMTEAETLAQRRSPLPVDADLRNPKQRTKDKK